MHRTAFRHIESIKDRYNSGETTPSIARSFSVSPNAIGALLKRHGVVLRGNVDAQSVRRQLDEAAFDELTDSALYWAGFLFADGCISDPADGKNNPVVSLVLSTIDEDHILKFKGFVRSDHAITKYQASGFTGSGQAVRIAFRSRTISDRLVALGMTNPSAMRMATPELATSRHFWRGVLDGDGYLRIRRFANPGWTDSAVVGLVGWYPLVKQFQEFCAPITGSVALPCAAHRIHDFRLTSRNAERIVKVLYEDAPVFLDRKMEVAKQIIALSQLKRKMAGKGAESYKKKAAVGQPAS